jgi:hypothetical protein
MKDNKMHHLYKWMWWTKGECVVEVLRTGHFPTTAMVVLPNDKQTEIDINELEMPQDNI